MSRKMQQWKMTAKDHIENIGEKAIVYKKTTFGNTARQVKIRRDSMWTGPARVRVRNGLLQTQQGLTS